MKSFLMRLLSVAVVFGVSVGSMQSVGWAKPKLNAPRVAGEPGWQGKIILRGEEKELRDATPVLERDYRPLHVIGNTQRRHHYRDTIIPSHQDRTDMLKAFTQRNR